LNFYFEEEEIEITADQLMLQIELQQFFQYYRVLNANFLAQRIGMNATLLSQYVRGVKQPSQKQTQKILQGIQLIGKELSDFDFIQK
jgi:DNA-binding transcriptional regulator YdaS (Cro superfamily)